MRSRYIPLPLLLPPLAPIGAQDGPRAQKICLAPASVEAAPTGSDPVGAARETFTGFPAPAPNIRGRPPVSG